MGCLMYNYSGPVKDGHPSPALTKTLLSKRIVMADDSLRKAYAAAYREANREKLRQQAREYYATHKDQQKANMADWRVRNPEWLKANYQRQREKITTDPDRIEAVRQQRRKHAKTYPERSTAQTRKRQAAQLQRTPAWLTDANFKAMLVFYEEAKSLTEQTGVKYEVDHIVPLLGENVCGLHVPWNLQILTQSENRSKGNKHD